MKEEKIDYIDRLTKDEIYYVCSIMPLGESVYHFKQNPKDFAKIRRGFRPTLIRQQGQLTDILFKNIGHPFISSFVESHITQWMDEIQKLISQKMDDGISKESALLQVLPFCKFSDNLKIYNKLIKEDDGYSEECVELLIAATKLVNENHANQQELEQIIIKKDFEIKKLQDSLNTSQVELKKISIELDKSSSKILELESSKLDFEKLQAYIHTNEETITELKLELSISNEKCQQLESQIQDRLCEQQICQIYNQKTSQKPKCPKDLNEFKQRLCKYLKDNGVQTDEMSRLLTTHLSKILFNGLPVIINRKVGIALLSCIANALTGTSNVMILTFKNDISELEIDEFLSKNGRIVCLDNFIGNYNETILIPIIDKHKDKIIFLTVAYDRTIYFVPDEFLRYCQYLNLNRIEALQASCELDEDSFIIDEREITLQKTASEQHSMRYVSTFRKILNEVGIHQSLIEHKCIGISSEEDVCRVLAFDILPYCVDVLKISPYNLSEELSKYAGYAGKCYYRNLFMEWFL